MLKKSFAMLLIFTMTFFSVFQFSTAMAKQGDPFKALDIELSHDVLNSEYLEEHINESDIEYKKEKELEIYSLNLNGIMYELTYNSNTEMYSTKAYDISNGQELDIEKLNEEQSDNGEVVQKNNNAIIILRQKYTDLQLFFEKASEKENVYDYHK